MNQSCSAHPDEPKINKIDQTSFDDALETILDTAIEKLRNFQTHGDSYTLEDLRKLQRVMNSLNRLFECMTDIIWVKNDISQEKCGK